MSKLKLIRIKRTHPEMLRYMSIHYSKPLGFVGRNICYMIMVEGISHGTIVGGSATKHLPNREIVGSLNNGVNNIFYHIEKQGHQYPLRNFASRVLALYRETIESDWVNEYGDMVSWHETLVELPRTGECYIRDGWRVIGKTKGFTCKRTSGIGTDAWSGKRVWDTVNLRPKLVFIHGANPNQNINQSSNPFNL